MRKSLLIVSSVILIIILHACQQNKKPFQKEFSKKYKKEKSKIAKTNNNLQYAKVLKSNNTKQVNTPQINNETKENYATAPYNDIIEREKYEYELLRDPATGKIPDGIVQRALVQGKYLPGKEIAFGRTANLNTYIPQGPDNLGGRTRAFAYDVRFATNQVMIAGSVSSGVMRSSNGGASWTLVKGTGNIHDITCITQDPRSGQQDTWYLGTGEALGNTSSETGAFRLGFGVYKSTDNGLTWNRLPGSNSGAYESFGDRRDLISKLVVDPTNGNVYMACVDQIQRSTDGGTTWSVVLTSTGGSTADLTDIVCRSSGVLYAAFAGTTGNGASNGVWTSSTGDSGTWVQIAGNGTPTDWKASGTYGRIVLALAPSNQNILYALYDNKATSGPKADLFQYDAGTSTWSNRSANLPNEGSSTGTFDSQGGYDLVVAVKPDDPNFVIIGGTNAYTSTDGFSTATSFKRIGGYASPSSFAKYANHHPDLHAFVFEPGSNIKMTSGDDGGIHLTSDVMASTVSWTTLNNSYQTYQYYYTAIDPTLGSTKYIGGAQDNGTSYRNAGTNSMLEVFGGDGVSVGISAGNTTHYVGFQLGDIYRRNSGSGPNFGTYIKPATETNSGLFVTLFHLNPDNTEDLYYANSTRLWRNTGASTATTAVGTSTGQWQQMTGVSGATGSNIRSFATTRGTYNPSHCLFIGTGGKILRLTDPRNADPATVPTDITPAGITAGSTVIGITVAPNNPNIALAVISNYNAASVFYTNNATAATPIWYNVEGTGSGKLDLPSFRSCAIVEKQSGTTRTLEYYVGTSVGLFSTTSIDATSQTTANNTSWVREGETVIDHAVVTSLPMRHGDNTMLIGTHGNGMFVSNIGGPVLPLTWVGTTSNDWNTASNWSPARVPTATDDVIIPTGAPNMPVSVTGTQSIYNLSLQNSASINVTGNLQVAGTFLNNGTISGAGNTTLNGTTFQSIAGTGAVSNMTLNNAAGASIAASTNMVNLTGVLTLTSGTLTTNGNLTLKSTAAGTASIATITGGALTGNATAERYTSDKRAWRLLGIPFSSSSQTIKAAWQEGATTATSDPNPPYGTHITTYIADPNAASFDAEKPFSSIRIYNANTFTSDALHTPNTTTPITSNQAYFLFVRGNRSIDLASATSHSAATLRITGTPTSGSVNRGVTGVTHSLIPNPYPSPIDFDAVKAANSSITTFYVWDATLGGTFGVGQYRTIQITGATAPYTYTATPGSASANWRFIESGTAFFIPGSSTVNFTEVMKSSGTPPSSMLRTTAGTETELVVNLNTINTDNTASLSDGVRLVFDNNYSASIDKNDAKKITGFMLNFGIVSNNEILSIEKRPLPTKDDVIALSVWNSVPGNYQFEIQPANFPSVALFAYLKDNYLDIYTPISLTAETKVDFTITSDPASAAANRFSIVFMKTSIPPAKNTIVVYPNPVQNGIVTIRLNNMPKGSYAVKLINSLGQTLLSRQIEHAGGSSTQTIGVHKIKGTYMIEILKPDNTKQANKLVIN